MRDGSCPQTMLVRIQTVEPQHLACRVNGGRKCLQRLVFYIWPDNSLQWKVRKAADIVTDSRVQKRRRG
jgi:hypothetical protein